MLQDVTLNSDSDLLLPELLHRVAFKEHNLSIIYILCRVHQPQWSPWKHKFNYEKTTFQL